MELASLTGDELILRVQKSYEGKDTWSMFTGSYGCMNTVITFLDQVEVVKL